MCCVSFVWQVKMISILLYLCTYVYHQILPSTTHLYWTTRHNFIFQFYSAKFQIPLLILNSALNLNFIHTTKIAWDAFSSCTLDFISPAMMFLVTSLAGSVCTTNSNHHNHCRIMTTYLAIFAGSFVVTNYSQWIMQYLLY